MVLVSNNIRKVLTVVRNLTSSLFEGPPLTRKDELVCAQLYCLYGIGRLPCGGERSSFDSGQFKNL